MQYADVKCQSVIVCLGWLEIKIAHICRENSMYR
jgi:hypothetical protein